MRLAWMLLLTCGCRQIFGISDPQPLSDSGPLPVDGSVLDSADAAPPGAICFSRPDINLGACFEHAPNVSFDVTAPVSIDTDQSTFCATTLSQTQDMCIVTATSVTVSAAVTATGSRPLVIFATAAIDIDSTFDVASHVAVGLGGSQGPGENPAACKTTEDGSNLGGGAGGSFTTRGGDGGRGGAGGSTPGLALDPFTAMTFHGGCRGGLGAGAVLGPAFGGGALAIIAATVLVDNNGVINASGAAGAGAAMGGHGGYGGGTGGMVVIAAEELTFSGSGQIFANGGAGGGGSSTSSTGNAGAEATSFNGNIIGGQGGNSSGAGGSAYPNAQSGMTGGGGNAGGGGGGGGFGAVILYTGNDLSGNLLRVSPQPSLRAF